MRASWLARFLLLAGLAFLVFVSATVLATESEEIPVPSDVVLVTVPLPNRTQSIERREAIRRALGEQSSEADKDGKKDDIKTTVAADAVAEQVANDTNVGDGGDGEVDSLLLRVDGILGNVADDEAATVGENSTDADAVVAAGGDADGDSASVSAAGVDPEVPQEDAAQESRSAEPATEAVEDTDTEDVKDETLPSDDRSPGELDAAEVPAESANAAESAEIVVEPDAVELPSQDAQAPADATDAEESVEVAADEASTAPVVTDFHGPLPVTNRLYQVELPNYLSVDAGAKLLKSSDDMQGAGSLLLNDAGKYMMCPCKAKHKSVTFQLSEEIVVRAVSLANLEHFSSSFGEFMVLGSSSHPTQQWRLLGRFNIDQDELVHENQVFLMPHPAQARYIKLRLMSHADGGEYFCTLTHFRVHGRTLLYEFRLDLEETEPTDHFEIAFQEAGTAVQVVDEQPLDGGDDIESPEDVETEEVTDPVQEGDDSQNQGESDTGVQSETAVNTTADAGAEGEASGVDVPELADSQEQPPDAEDSASDTTPTDGASTEDKTKWQIASLNEDCSPSVTESEGDEDLVDPAPADPVTSAQTTTAAETAEDPGDENSDSADDSNTASNGTVVVAADAVSDAESHATSAAVSTSPSVTEPAGSSSNSEEPTGTAQTPTAEALDWHYDCGAAPPDCSGVLCGCSGGQCDSFLSLQMAHAGLHEHGCMRNLSALGQKWAANASVVLGNATTVSVDKQDPAVIADPVKTAVVNETTAARAKVTPPANPTAIDSRPTIKVAKSSKVTVFGSLASRIRALENFKDPIEKTLPLLEAQVQDLNDSLFSHQENVRDLKSATRMIAQSMEDLETTVEDLVSSLRAVSVRQNKTDVRLDSAMSLQRSPFQSHALPDESGIEDASSADEPTAATPVVTDGEDSDVSKDEQYTVAELLDVIRIQQRALKTLRIEVGAINGTIEAVVNDVLAASLPDSEAPAGSVDEDTALQTEATETIVNYTAVTVEEQECIGCTSQPPVLNTTAFTTSDALRMLSEEAAVDSAVIWIIVTTLFCMCAVSGLCGGILAWMCLRKSAPGVAVPGVVSTDSEKNGRATGIKLEDGVQPLADESLAAVPKLVE